MLLRRMTFQTCSCRRVVSSSLILLVFAVNTDLSYYNNNADEVGSTACLFGGVVVVDS